MRTAAFITLLLLSEVAMAVELPRTTAEESNYESTSRYGDVMAFVGNDPYMQAGLFERVEVRPWDWSLGNPEQRV